MRKRVKMRGQSKWKNRFVVARLKSWWKKMRNGGWGWGDRRSSILYNLLQMIQDELAKKEMEKPVNLRNVERSLLKRVVDDIMRLLVFLTPKISVKSEAYNPEAYITLFQYWVFFENQSKFTSLYSITDT